MAHDDARTEWIKGAIHDSGWQLVLAITGGGASAIGQLLEVPGGSRSLLEAVVPYSWRALERWLQARPEHACSPRTARAMAMAAFWRARELAEKADDGTLPPLMGVGCTASLVSERPKRGAHRVHLAWQTATFTHTISIELQKGARTRPQEEAAVAAWLIDETARLCSPMWPQQPPPATPEPATIEHTDAPESWQRLLVGEIDCAGNEAAERSRETRAIFPGAFNPLHDGHRRMIEIASRKLGHPVALEISVENVDKPPLDFTEIAQRLATLDPAQACWLTRAPTFVLKAELFPGATFVVGADTIIRIADPKYYGGSMEARDAALAALARRGCRFLVFGRRRDGNFATLSDLQLPAVLADLCEEVPEEEFRQDISSTELRKAAHQEP